MFLSLVGCITEPTSKPTLLTEAESTHVRVNYSGIELGEWEGEKGFFVTIEAESLLDYSISDYSFTMQKTLLANEQSYEAKHSEIISNETDNTLLIRQFFSPNLSDDIEQLGVNVYVRPDYYKRTLQFSNLKDNDKNIIVNDFTIKSLQISGNKLTIHAQDVHEIKGLSISLLQEDEEIFPFFTSTDNNPSTNEVIVTYEFAKPLPESISLKVKRLHLQEKMWEFPLVVPIDTN